MTSNDSNGYSLGVDRTAFAPADLPLGIGVGGAALAAVPVAPASDLVLGTASAPSAPGGDALDDERRLRLAAAASCLPATTPRR